MNITTGGIDLAKNVFSVHGVDAQCKVVLKKTVTRGKPLESFANLPPCRVVMEACSGTHHWARQLNALGHDARIITLLQAYSVLPKAAFSRLLISARVGV